MGGRLTEMLVLEGDALLTGWSAPRGSMCWLLLQRKASSRSHAWCTANVWRARDLSSAFSLWRGSRSGGNPLTANEYPSRNPAVAMPAAPGLQGFSLQQHEVFVRIGRLRGLPHWFGSPRIAGISTSDN